MCIFIELQKVANVLLTFSSRDRVQKMDETEAKDTKELIDELKLKSEAVKTTEPTEGSLKDTDSNPRVYTDPDGTQYEWDDEKRAWFPKVLWLMDREGAITLPNYNRSAPQFYCKSQHAIMLEFVIVFRLTRILLRFIK